MAILKKYKKLIFNTLFVIAVFVITCYSVFNGKDLNSVWECMLQAKGEYIVVAILTIPVFVMSESVIIWYLLKKVSYEVRLRDCFRYSYIGFFVSCITPSASGGQPAQLYFMGIDGINPSISTFILLIITVGYKSVLVFFGAIAWLFAKGWLVSSMGIDMIFFYYGMIVNIVCIFFMSFLVFSYKNASRCVRACTRFLMKIHILKKDSRAIEKVEESMEKYETASIFLRKNKSVLITVFIISLFQRVILFWVTWLVYKSLGLSGTSMWTIIMLQAMISLSVDMLPLPGGMGVSENIFLNIFKDIFGEEQILPAMLISRGISFYSLVVVSGVVTMISYIMVNVRRQRK